MQTKAHQRALPPSVDLMVIPLWQKTWFASLCLLLFTLLAYIPSYQAGFIWDDDVIAENPVMKEGWRGLRDIWFSTKFGDFCPVTATTFWIEWQIHGAMAPIQHATNIVLQALNAVLLWRVLVYLRIPGAWLAAAIFAVHPVSVASVTWLAERKNTLSMFFYLLSLEFYFKASETRSTEHGHEIKTGKPLYSLAILTFILGLLSKSSVVVLPVVILLCDWWRKGKINWASFQRVLPFFLFAFAAGVATLVAHFYFGPKLGVLPSEDSLLIRTLTATRAFWFYAAKDILPVGLTMHYARWPIDPGSLLTYLPGLTIVAMVVLFWRFRQTWGKAALFGVGYFAVALAPTLGIVNMAFLMMAQVADHLQYLALPGLIALFVGPISYLLQRSTKPTFVVLLLSVLLLLPATILSWNHQRLMANPEALWRDNLSKNPTSWTANNNLGGILFERGQFAQAEEYYRKALQSRNGVSFLQVNLGRALFSLGRTEEAVTKYADALRIDAKDFNAWNNSAVALLHLGKTNEAIFSFQKAVEIAPGNTTFAENLGRLLQKSGRTQEAIQFYTKALERMPTDANFHYELAKLLAGQNELANAISHYEQAVRLVPDSVDARFGYAEALLRHGKTAGAMSQWQQILKLAPDKIEVLGNLAWALATSRDDKLRNGREAARLAEHARTLAPSNMPTVLDLVAVAYAEDRRFDEARKIEEQAEALAMTLGEKELAGKYRMRLDLFRAGKPFHE